MVGEEVNIYLPEELVEKVIARMPFPSIFKAQSLSKAWRARFKPISSLADEEEKQLARLFQKEVAECSNKWETFYPVCSTLKMGFMGYVPASGKWQRLPSFQRLDESLDALQLEIREIEGALLIGSPKDNWDATSAFCVDDLYVANILTREWMELPPPFLSCICHLHCLKLVGNTSLGTYKLIVVCTGSFLNLDSPSVNLHVYDSKLGTWKSKIFRLPYYTYIHQDMCVCLDGVLYMVRRAYFKCLLAFNVQEETMEELTLSCTDDIQIHIDYDDHDDDMVTLEVCNANLVMIWFDGRLKNIHVLHIDVESRRMWEAARCDLASETFLWYIPISDVDTSCIFYDTGDIGIDGLMLAYDQPRDNWNFFYFPTTPYEWTATSFRPGLNPFMPV